MDKDTTIGKPPLGGHTFDPELEVEASPLFVERGLELSRYLNTLCESFYSLFRGNEFAHYIRHKDSELQYESVKQGITLSNVLRHLAGRGDSLLSIPINRNGLSHFGAIDYDRHTDADTPIDHEAFARQVTELNLPLVVFQSKGGKGAWLFLFLKESQGIPASSMIALLKKYCNILKLPADSEIFPKQSALKESNGEWQQGNGINLPYFGEERVAFGKNGEALNLDEFLEFAHTERSFYGTLLVTRDLTTTSEAASLAPQSQVTEETNYDIPLTLTQIKRIYANLLEKLRASKPGIDRNTNLNNVCLFAGRGCAANALVEKHVRAEIRKIGADLKIPEREFDATAKSGFGVGKRKSLIVLDWRKKFRTGSQLEAGAVRVYIEGILPEGVTGIGSLSGVGKTWFALAMARALCTGTKFMGVFDVPEAIPVVYLVPEMGDRSLRTRMEKMRLPMNDMFYCQTIRDGICRLSDPILEDIISSIKPVLFLDTAIRFNTSDDENSARQNAGQLAFGLFRLLTWGAKAVVFLHHSPKSSSESEFMTLENVLRGTGDLGAMCDAVWGLQHEKQKRDNGKDWDYEYLDESQKLTRLSVRCVKTRDFDPRSAFRVTGRPYIDDKGDFAVIAEVEDKDVVDKIIEEIVKDPKISTKQLRRKFGIGYDRLIKIAKEKGWFYDKKIWTKAPFDAQASFAK